MGSQTGRWNRPEHVCTDTVEQALIKPDLRNALFCAVTIIALVALMSGSLLAREKLTVIAQNRSQAELTSVISDIQQLVTARYAQARTSTSLIANSPVVVTATKSMLQDGQAGRTISTEDVLKAYLDPLVREQGYLGYAVLSFDGTVIVSHDPHTNALISKRLDQSGLFVQAAAGNAVTTPPMFVEPQTQNPGSQSQEPDIESVVIAPIKDKDGNALALFAVRFDLESELEKLTRLGRFRDTGETVVFNRDGRILARPRFDIAMHETVGHADHKHALLQFPDLERSQVRTDYDADQDQTLSKARSTAREFVDRLRESQQNNTLSNLYSYVSYHGARVLGVWYWDEALGIGYSTEILESEGVGHTVTVTMMVGLLAVIMLYILTILFLILRGDEAKADKKKSIADIVNTVPDSILTVSEDGLILSANSQSEKRLGVIANEINPLNLAKFISSDGLVEGTDIEDRHNLDNQNHIDLSQLAGRTLRCRAYHTDGTSFSAEIVVSTKTEQEPRQYTCLVRDIMDRLRSEEAIHKLIYFDPLTGLANRNEFNRRLEDAIKEARRNGTLVSVMLLDLDRFKQINEAFGHDTGDQILQTVSDRLRQTAREVDTIGRLSADEFVFVATGLNNLQDVTRPAERILKALSEPIEIDGYTHHVEACIGISFYPQDDESRAELVRKADIALYQAKQMGSGQIHFYDNKLDEEVRANKVLEDELRTAIKNRSLQLYYQPQLGLKGEVMAVEALLRWQRKDGTFVSPNVFVSLAERCNVIGEIGEWVLQEACRQAKEWAARGMTPLRIAVNLSPVQFSDATLVDKVEAAVKNAGLDPRTIELEVTESVVMGNIDQAMSKLRSFKEKGFSLSIDDFGTGHSSLAYLKDLPVDRIKIDKSFLDGVPDNKGNLSIVSTVISLGKSLGLEVVAEGVETLAQWKELEKLGCHYVQGYYFSRPLPAPDFEKWYKSRAKSPAADLLSKIRNSQDSA
ncbi:MAG: EAL domain-containing protein [Alphaproteobacteria bacterium]|nr:MAG: EAL domain-containing protein [Alphaproteobacteria bacterium]